MTDMARGEIEAEWKEGVKDGASALSCFLVAEAAAEPGMATGLALVELEPEPADVDVLGVELTGEIDLRSVIIRCKLDIASPPCFFAAAAVAASMAVMGVVTGACKPGPWDVVAVGGLADGGADVDGEVEDGVRCFPFDGAASAFGSFRFRDEALRFKGGGFG